MFFTGCGSKTNDYRSNKGKSSDATKGPGYVHYEKDKKSTSKDKPKIDNADEEVNFDDVLFADLPTSMGIRNYDQINFTLAKLTGISRETLAVSAAFAELKNKLPMNNDIKSLTAAQLSAVTKLSAQYCDEMAGNATARTTVLPSLNFSQPPSQAFADAQVTAKELIEHFWGKDYKSLADQKNDVQIISELITEMKAGKPETIVTTKNVVMGACTAVIISSPVLIF